MDVLEKLYATTVQELSWFQRPIGGDGGIVLLCMIRLAVGFIEVNFARRALVARPVLYLMALTVFLTVLTAPLAPLLSIYTLLGNSLVGLYFWLAWAASQQISTRPEEMQRIIVQLTEKLSNKQADCDMYKAGMEQRGQKLEAAERRNAELFQLLHAHGITPESMSHD